MPGVLPYWMSNALTSATGGRVDFSNFGRTLNEKGIVEYFSSYRDKQQQDRIYIWSGMLIGGAAAGFAEYLYNEGASYSTGLAIILGAAAGTFKTHHDVSEKRIAQRLADKEQTRVSKSNIVAKVCDMKTYVVGGVEQKDLVDNIDAVIAGIEAYNMADGTDRINLTATLSKRKRAMERVLNKISGQQEGLANSDIDGEQLASFWTQATDSLLDHFINKTALESENTLMLKH